MQRGGPSIFTCHVYHCCWVLHPALLAAAAAAATVLQGDDVPEQFDADFCSVIYLRSLKCLTGLTLNMEDYSDTVWRSIAKLTGLRDLHIRELDIAEFGGIVNLVECRQLTRLRTDNTEESLQDFDMEVSLLPTALCLVGLSAALCWLPPVHTVLLSSRTVATITIVWSANLMPGRLLACFMRL
jgi:hypothetical protein